MFETPKIMGLDVVAHLTLAKRWTCQNPISFKYVEDIVSASLRCHAYLEYYLAK